MNKKGFIKWQIKESLPLYIIAAIVLAAVFWIPSISNRLVPSLYFNDNNYTTSTMPTMVYYLVCFPPLFYISIPAIIFACFLPISCFSHQTNHVRSDFFYQIPMKEKELRNTKVLLNFAILEIIYTIVYWVGILFIFVNQSSQNAIDPYFSANPYFYNYIYFVPYFFLLMVEIALTYFTSSFLASLATRNKDCGFYIVFGQLFLAFSFMAILLFFIRCGSFNYLDSFSQFTISFPNFSWLESEFHTFIFSDLIYKVNYLGNNTNLPNSYNAIYIAARIFSSVCFLITGGLSAWGVLFKKDPSGEFAGKAGMGGKIASTIPHLTMGMIGLFVACGVSTSYGTIGMYIFYILWGVLYYFSLVIVNGSFHFSKKKWITYLSVCGGVILLTIVMVVSSNIVSNIEAASSSSVQDTQLI